MRNAAPVPADAHRQDIGDLDVLVKASVESDVLDADSTRAFLKSDEGIADYEQGVEHSRRQGITGVPFFIFSGQSGKKLALSGAQDPETFVQVRPRRFWAPLTRQVFRRLAQNEKL